MCFTYVLNNRKPLTEFYFLILENKEKNINCKNYKSLFSQNNKLTQWFSPELLAQASAGKLPLLNINEAVSLEEFERRIQHSSTIVNN